MSELYKVWGGLISGFGQVQCRTIIATRTKKEAIRILDVTRYEFDNYWTETWNNIERTVALEKPNTIFQAPDHLVRVFKERGEFTP